MTKLSAEPTKGWCHPMAFKESTRLSPGTEEATRSWARAAEGRRDPEAVFEYARCLLTSPARAGRGYEPSKGLELLKQAAQRQHLGALELLGEMYRSGSHDHIGLRHDPAQASRCFSQAAGIRREEVASLKAEKERAECQLLLAGADFDNALRQRLLAQRRTALTSCFRSATARAHRRAWAPWIAETRRWPRSIAAMQRALSAWSGSIAMQQRRLAIIGRALGTHHRRRCLHRAMHHWLQ